MHAVNRPHVAVMSHNAEQAFINSGEPAHKVLSLPQMASDDI
jgi:hypothetical protein